MATATKKDASVAVTAPNFLISEFIIKGTAPYVQHKFSHKLRQQMKEKQMAGSTARKGTKREPKDFESLYEDATHVSEEGWHGFMASGLRNALVSACKLCGFHMTKAKMAVFVMGDGLDVDEGTPMVRLYGEREKFESMTRVKTGDPNITVRPMWRQWYSVVRIKHDADQFTHSDIANLLMRVGVQVGIGEGRPDSKSTCGMGWGTFEIYNGEIDELRSSIGS